MFFEDFEYWYVVGRGRGVGGLEGFEMGVMFTSFQLLCRWYKNKCEFHQKKTEITSRHKPSLVMGHQKYHAYWWWNVPTVMKKVKKLKAKQYWTETATIISWKNNVREIWVMISDDLTLTEHTEQQLSPKIWLAGFMNINDNRKIVMMLFKALKVWELSMELCQVWGRNFNTCGSQLFLLTTKWLFKLA